MVKAPGYSILNGRAITVLAKARYCFRLSYQKKRAFVNSEDLTPSIFLQKMYLSPFS